MSLKPPVIPPPGTVACRPSRENSARHCANGSSQIKGIGFYPSYSPVAHADSFRINIAIASMHRLTARILDVSNEFQNTNVPIHEIVTNFRIHMFPFMKEFLSVNHTIISTGLKYLTPMFLLIEMMDHFFFNV